MEKNINRTCLRFKEVRTILGLTQQKLADKLLLSQNYIAQIEIGAKVPSERALRDLENLLVKTFPQSIKAEPAEDKRPYGGIEGKARLESRPVVGHTERVLSNTTQTPFPTTREQLHAQLDRLLDIADDLPGGQVQIQISLPGLTQSQVSPP